MLGWNQIVEVSRAEARQTFLGLLEEIGFAATSWQEGSIQLAFVELLADFWSRGSKIAVAMKSFGLNETATGEALTRFSRSHYQNERLDAVAEQRLTTLACSADEGPHTLNVGDVVLSNAAGDVFRNVADPNGVFPPSYPVNLPSGGTVQLVMEADVPGSGPNTEAGGVTTMVATFAGVTVAEDLVRRAGVDRESDERLRLRNSLKWALLTRFGLIDEAVVALALEASPSVSRVAVDSSNPRGPGTFDVYITGTIGNAGTEALDLVQAAIEPYLMGELVNPGGPDEHHTTSGGERVMLVQEAPPEALNLAGEVYLSAEYDWEDVEPLLLAHLEAWRQTIPLGGFPYPSPGNRVPINEIEHQIRNFTIGGERPIRTVVLTQPTGDVVVPAFGHVTEGDWDGLEPTPVV